MSMAAVDAALDVLIVGAGPAGCATALALRQAGVRRVALLESRPKAAAPGWRLGESATPDVPGLLERLGLAWPAGHRPCLGNASAWGQTLWLDDFARRRLPPAWHVDRALLDEQLRGAAVQAGALLLRGHALDAVRRLEPGWQVELRAGADGERPGAATRLGARLLVDASGRAAVLARYLGAQRQAVDRQVALASPWPGAEPAGGWPAPGPAHPLHQRVLVEAVPEGWWTAAPDALGRPQLALMTDADLAPALRAPQAWWAALRRSRALWPALAPWAPPEMAPEGLRPRPCAAHAACLDRVAGPGWLALGDAMMSLDPLTSSGLSGSLRDAWEACHGVLLTWLAGQDAAPPGRAWGWRARSAWEAFLRERRERHAQAAQWPQMPYWRRRLPPPHAAPWGETAVPPALSSPRSSRTAPHPPSP